MNLINIYKRRYLRYNDKCSKIWEILVKYSYEGIFQHQNKICGNR